MKLIYILLAVTLILCISGIASAAGNSSITLFTTADTTAAQKTIDSSGLGYVFALMDLVGKYLVVVVIFALLIMGLIYRAMNNAEKYKGVLAAIFYVIGLLLVVQVAYSIVTTMLPNISTISF